MLPLAEMCGRDGRNGIRLDLTHKLLVNEYSTGTVCDDDWNRPRLKSQNTREEEKYFHEHKVVEGVHANREVEMDGWTEFR